MSLFHPLATELVRAGRLDDARRYARVAGEVNDRTPFFLQFVEELSPDGSQDP